MLGPSLTAFGKVTINSSGFSRLVTFALHPNKPRPFYLDYDDNMSVKRYIMKRIVEELQPTLGSAAVVDEYRRRIVEFRPCTSTQVCNNGKQVTRVRSTGQKGYIGSNGRLRRAGVITLGL